MKIVYMITRSTWGGAQAHLYELIKNRVKKGDTIYLIVGNKGVLTERVNQLNSVEIIVMNSLVRELSPLKDIKCIKEVRRFFKTIKPDIIHLHSSKAGAVGRIAAFKLHSKVVFTAHGWAFTEGVKESKRKLYAKLEKILCRVTDKIICVSEYDYNLANKNNVIDKPSKAIIIKNGVEETSPINHENKIPVITMAARFDTPKNQILLIQSLNRVKYPFMLNLIGDGPQIGDCEAIIRDLNMQNKIKLLGFQSDVIKYLQQSDVFTLISNYEGLPISIIEAMSTRLPIIASDVGGVSELILNNKNGYCVKNNIEEIANAFNKILSDEKTRCDMGEESYKRYQDEFRIDKNLELINNLYADLLGE